MSDVLPGLLVALLVAALVALALDGCPPGTRRVGGVVDGRRWSICVAVEMPDQKR